MDKHLPICHTLSYNRRMARIGRPATGQKPVVSVRMAPEALKRALEHAKERKTPLGRWLEEAIQEKIEREVNHD